VEEGESSSNIEEKPTRRIFDADKGRGHITRGKGRGGKFVVISSHVECKTIWKLNAHKF
jgi:hypothetical protein